MALSLAVVTSRIPVASSNTQPAPGAETAGIRVDVVSSRQLPQPKCDYARPSEEPMPNSFECPQAKHALLMCTEF